MAKSSGNQSVGNKVMIGVFIAIISIGTISVLGYGIHYASSNREALHKHENKPGHQTAIEAIETLKETTKKQGETLMELKDSSSRQEALQEEILRRLP